MIILVQLLFDFKDKNNSCQLALENLGSLTKPLITIEQTIQQQGWFPYLHSSVHRSLTEQRDHMLKSVLA